MSQGSLRRGRAESGVQQIPVVKEVASSPTWSDAEIKQLEVLWLEGMPIAYIALDMDYSFASIQTMASRIGLPPRESQSQRHRKRWTPEEDHMITNIIDTKPTLDVLQVYANSIMRTLDAVVGHIQVLYTRDDRDGKALVREIFERSRRLKSFNQVRPTAETSSVVQIKPAREMMERTCIRSECRSKFKLPIAEKTITWVCRNCRNGKRGFSCD